jgi:hypothetical protein
LDIGIFGFFEKFRGAISPDFTPLFLCGCYNATVSKVLQNMWCGYETVFTGKQVRPVNLVGWGVGGVFGISFSAIQGLK